VLLRCGALLLLLHRWRIDGVLLRLLLMPEVCIQRRRREGVGLLLKGRVLLCHGRLHLLLLIACSSGRAVVEKAALPGALLAVVAAGVRVTVLPASALRRNMMAAANLAEGKRAWVARAA